jgi:hypothetical protein
MIRNLISTIAATCLAAWLVLAGAQDDASERRARTDESIDRTPQKCISNTRIRTTEILDDRTILFYLRGGRVYRNFLDQECPGLERSGRFITQTQTSRLCDTDNLTVLDQFGSRFDPGFTCRLGEFHPITEEEAELMELEPDEAAAAGRAVEITPVELPQEEDEEAEAE